MKTIQSLLFAILVLASSCNVALAGGEDHNAKATKSGKSLSAFSHKSFMSTTRPGTLWLITLKEEAKPVRVNVQNLDGQTISSFQVYSNRVMHSVDCTQLPAGQYKLLLERGSQVEQDTFEVK